jgi:phosphate-selective porin OprO/OprP
MKKYKHTLLLLFVLSPFLVFTQEDDWTIAHSQNGNFSIISEDGKYRFTPGGRFTLDGAYLQEDITALSSGTRIKEARLSTSFKIDKVNIFFEIDFERSQVNLKDITARYNFTDHSFIKAGHYVEPFSVNYLTTTEKIPFISRPSTATAFAPPRSLGITYRHYQKHFWFEGGVFGDNVNQTYKGKDGYSITGRLLGIPIAIPNSHLHVGVSGSYRISDNRGFDEDGSSYYNRKLNFTAGLQNYIDNQLFLTAYIGPSGKDSYGQTDLEDLRNGGAKNQVQIDFEIMDIYRNFYWQAEYIHTRVNRVMNKEKILDLERAGELYPETWDDISYKYGEMRPLNFQGYYVQASYLIFGGNYKYNRSTGTITRLTNRALEFSARYNYTNLNDIEGNYINGKFYTDEGINQSIAGGITTSYSFVINFVLNENVRFLAEFTNQKIDNYDDFKNPDESINIFQGRLQVVF